MAVPYVHSGYERIPDDNYQTVDGRCVQALVETWPIEGRIVDCCAPQGSGIASWLKDNGHDAYCAGTVNFIDPADWIVTNPPYLRGVVDEIATGIVGRVRAGEVKGAVLLMRANWDLAACRSALFADPLYRGQTRLRFRPFWSEDRRAQPIHSFVLHVWSEGSGEPIIRYWPKP